MDSQIRSLHQTTLDTVDENSEVAIRFVCGGKHTITVAIGGERSPFTVHVTGVPKVGSRVTEGPDWPEGQMGDRRQMRSRHRTQSRFGMLDPSAGLDGREVMNGVVDHVHAIGGVHVRNFVGRPGASQSTNQQGGLDDRVYNVEVCLNPNDHNTVQENGTYQWGKGCYQIELV